jgi:tetratricopeptide (TPR) repeat protein
MKRLWGWFALVLLGVPLVTGAHPSALERLDRLSEAIRAHPKDPSNYVRRGQVERDAGHFENARRDFEQAERLGDPILVAFDQGVLQYRMGNLAEARRHLDAFLARFPGHAQALETRARVSRDAGDSAAALADFKAYFALRANAHPGDYVSAARLLASDPDEGVAPALALLDEGMARLGVVAQLQRPAIDLERRRGRNDLALARLETLEPALGRSPDWKVDRAEALLGLDRPVEARAELVAARAQLDGLPNTRARVKLRARIDSLDAEPNALTPDEQAGGWELLFDGRSFAGWKNYGASTDDAIEGWRIHEGALELTRDVSFAGLIWNHINPFGTAALDLMTEARFSDFELSIDWKISSGGNSGIFYLVADESAPLAWTKALEMQVLDDAAHRDGEHEKRRAGDLYDLVASATRAARPVGQWNRARIRVEGDRVEHWLNGEKLLEIVRGSAEWDRVVADSKHAHVLGYGLAREGHILLQDHGDPVGYRNIKLRQRTDAARRRPSPATATSPANSDAQP